MAAPARYRLGVDIGGTFTDLCLQDIGTGEMITLKTPTVRGDLARGVANGIAMLAERGVRAEQIEYVVNGTTIAANAVIQRTGSRVALVVTEGFRDVLEMARVRLPVPWSFSSRRPVPLVPRQLVVPVRERVLHTGQIGRSLTDAEIARVADVIERLDVEGVAICLLHSYANPSHELALKGALAERMPQLPVSCSAEIWPQMREYERAMVTVLNAYIRPLMMQYLKDLDAALRTLGVDAPAYITRSNGGVMTSRTAKEEVVHTLLSGPAAGMIGALDVARVAHVSRLITFDMGGTSADVAVVEDGQLQHSSEEHVGDFPVILPVVGVSSVGAGGGSIAWVDPAGVLKVGPQSAGSDPGPACYGLGGDQPTLTDAFLLCGYLNPTQLAGGSKLDYVAAESVIGTLGASVELTPEETAGSVVRIALATMYIELSAVLERKGIDPRDFTLLAFGGAGPIVACMLAEEINVPRVLVPLSPGTLSAFGALKADVMSDFIRSGNWRLSAGTLSDLGVVFADLEQQARGWLERESPPLAGIELRRSADMRYTGQSHEIEVALDDAWIRDGDHGSISEAFHRAHQRRFSHADPSRNVEMVSLRVQAVGRMPRVPSKKREPVAAGPPTPLGTRTVFSNGGPRQASLFLRTSLASGHVIDGPAVVEQFDTATVVPARWRATVDRWGNLDLTRMRA